MEFGRFIDGAFEDEGDWMEVVSPGDGAIVGRVRVSDGAQLERALAAAARINPSFSRTALHERAAVLGRAADLVERRAAELAEIIVLEAGKPVLLARAEVARAAATIRMSVDAARGVLGELASLDGYPQGAGLLAVSRRFPVGPVAAISPFNFPLMLAVHKIAPALAVGCPVIHKPARKTPLSACVLAEILSEAGLPRGAYQVCVSPPEIAERLALDPRIALLTFTGSPAVGWHLKALAARKRCVLELGGNAAAIVAADADLERAARQIAIGAYANAGQVCISVQRIFAAAAIYGAFREALLDAIGRHVRVGDPRDPAVLVGPMISAAEASRVEAWTAQALDAGARSLTGPLVRVGNTVHPVLLEGAPSECRIVAEEVFGPVATLARFSTFEEAIAMANDSRFGLQAGVFTKDIDRALYAFEHLEVGAVVLNDAPTRRVDHMPYGGVKESGEGREGPRRAVEHMTEERVLLISR